MSFRAAEAFRSLSRVYLDAVDPNVVTAGGTAAADLGGMISSATNLVLGVELYLKSLQLMAGSQPPKTHDLVQLFQAMPADLQAEIRRRYELILANSPGSGVASTLNLAVWWGDTPPASPPQDGAPEIGDHSLEAVLERNKDSFQIWRYLHERGILEQFVYFSFEFRDLDAVASALRSLIIEAQSDWPR